MKYLKIVLYILWSTISFSKLQQVFSLFRHGARQYETNLNSDSKVQLFQQLTAIGMRQHQTLGKLIRKQYINDKQFLSFNYKSEQIEGYTTPFNRTIQSLMSFFYGLYPPGTGYKLPNKIKANHLQPPYKRPLQQRDSKNLWALPKGHQIIGTKLNQTLMLQDCPNKQIFVKDNFRQIQGVYSEMKQRYKPFFTRLTKIFNLTQSLNFDNLYSVFDHLNVDKSFGREYPNQITQADFQNLQHLVLWYFLVKQSNNNTILANSGKFQKLFSEFDTRIHRPQKLLNKWTFIVAHDVDLIPMEIALNISSAQCVEEMYLNKFTAAINCKRNGLKFSISIIIELHSKQFEYYVKVRVDGKYVYLCEKQSYECAYRQFKRRLSGQITNKIQNYCGRQVSIKQQQFNLLTTYVSQE